MIPDVCIRCRGQLRYRQYDWNAVNVITGKLEAVSWDMTLQCMNPLCGWGMTYPCTMEGDEIQDE